jgi:uncharacterized protein involved in exopolysaccharide biosynthesis
VRFQPISLSQYKVHELQSILVADPITDAVMTSQAEVLRGMPVIEQIVKRLNLDANPEFNPALRSPAWSLRVLSLWRSRMSRDGSARRTEVPGPDLDPARNATLSAV